MRTASLLLSFLLLPWGPAPVFVTAEQQQTPRSFFKASRDLHLHQEAEPNRHMGSLVAADAYAANSEMPLWSPRRSHPTESDPSAAVAAHRTPIAEGSANTRGTQLGVQEPLSFYGNVHVADPMPVAEVPKWIWSSSTVICLLLLLLWVAHQRRFSLVATQLRQIERRCFSPPAALYMSLVYSFFPLSGAIAWLSLLEPRVGLLLSQLRSAWEVCCLHCFMLLMLHLMGGPETTLLLIQQHSSLPPPENNGKALDDAKQVFISTGVNWGGKRDGKEFPPFVLPEQKCTQTNGEMLEKAAMFQSRLVTARRPSQSHSNCNSNNSRSSSNSNSHRVEGASHIKLSAARSYRRGLSAPNVLCGFPAVEQPTAAAAARMAASQEKAPAVKAEQQLILTGMRRGARRTAPGFCSDAASSASQEDANIPEPQQIASEWGPGKSEAAAEPIMPSPSAVHAVAYGAAGSNAPEPLEGVHTPRCFCAGAGEIGHRKCIRWTRARRVFCFSNMSRQGLNKTESCSGCSGGNRHSGPGCISHSSSRLRNNGSSSRSSPIESIELQRTRSTWRRCRERLHRRRFRFGSLSHRRSTMPSFPPTVVAAARGIEVDRSPFKVEALLPACRVSPAAPPAVSAASSASSFRDCCSANASKVPEHRLQHQQGGSEKAKATRSDKVLNATDGGSVAGAIDAATSAVEACSTNTQHVVKSPSPAFSTFVADARQQRHKLSQKGPPQQQQARRVLRMGATEAGPSGSGAAVPGSTCSTALTSHGSSPAVLFGGKERGADATSMDIHQNIACLSLQQKRNPTSAADGASTHEQKVNETSDKDRRIWFVPPLCCLAWRTKARAFSAWDLRMSYRCLLPFTVLKLLRVLLCYLLSTLMHLGNEGEKAAAAAGVHTDASTVMGGGASHQHVLQRLLQICCFFSLVIAMWGLAVVFVATRPLLKPFNIGWKFTCLKALVFFIQLLELAAEALQPISLTAVSATDGSAAAAMAAAQKVYIFTFLELLGSAVCAVMATWAYKPGDLLSAHQLLLLLRKQLPLGAAPAMEVNGSCSSDWVKRKLTVGSLRKLIAATRGCCFRRNRCSLA